MSKASKDILAAKAVLDREVEGLQALSNALDDKFTAAVDLLFQLKGRVIIGGMGKSGHIARKIAATLASTGTPALFVHPAEASHGDLGMVTKEDAVILLSNSGETAELSDIIEYCRRFSIPLIGVVRRPTSALVEAADIAFVLPEIPEASPVNAPTTSTIMMLAWGDALAVALMERRGFSKEDFNTFHPGGKLGSQLAKVDKFMKTGDALPVVGPADTMAHVLIVMTEKSLGLAVVADDQGKPVGVITDGDLRRHMGPELLHRKAQEVMTKNPITIRPTRLAVEALKRMNNTGKGITSLCVTDPASGRLVGIIHIHDLLRAGVS